MPADAESIWHASSETSQRPARTGLERDSEPKTSDRRGPVRSRSSEASDRAALEALYYATDGPNWVNNNNWLSESPLNDWAGITAEIIGEEERVVGREPVEGAADMALVARVGHGAKAGGLRKR